MPDEYTFPKKIRLVKSIQFRETLTTDFGVKGKFFVCYYRANQLTYPRIGIITAKKKCHLAVSRNRLKRQVREAFRYHQSKLPNYDMVIMARKDAAEAGQSELRQCLDNLFAQLTSGLTAGAVKR